MKFQIPNPKSQTSSKSQIPNLGLVTLAANAGRLLFFVWNLVLGISLRGAGACLGFGIWDLGFPAKQAPDLGFSVERGAED
jgi:hypothetical protein